MATEPGHAENAIKYIHYHDQTPRAVPAGASSSPARELGADARTAKIHTRLFRAILLRYGRYLIAGARIRTCLPNCLTFSVGMVEGMSGVHIGRRHAIHPDVLLFQ